MKKYISLIKACMTDNMRLFKINSKKQSEISKKIIPVILAIVLFLCIISYANIIIEPLVEVHFEFVLLTIFVLLTSIMTLIEGIYKSSSLLFNCKDDNLLLSLPIKKSTVLFIRVLKFYLFELIYNSLFLIPAMIVYIRYVDVGVSFYVVSFLACLLLPIIPIVLSCIIGVVISAFSSKFKMKNFIQIIITTLFLIAIIFISNNLDKVIEKIAQNASSINEIITKIYYPAGAYIKLVTDFNILDLVLFIIIHLLVFTISIYLLSIIYFKINSAVKTVKIGTKNKDYRIKENKPMKSLIKKEVNRFINSPVFVINAGFGLVLFIIGSIGICLKFDSIVEIFNNDSSNFFNIEQIKSYMPVILFGLICFASLMSSITSSMISLEGKSFNILKGLPIKPFKIIVSKILTAILIMIPFFIIGDIIVFIKFNFSIGEIIICLISSFILPFVAETIGIMVNLKYPKMDAENDTEVVKQSISSMIAVFIGMILSGITVYLLYKGIENGISSNLIILSGMSFYTFMAIVCLLYLTKKSVKYFNDINV